MPPFAGAPVRRLEAHCLFLPERCDFTVLMDAHQPALCLNASEEQFNRRDRRPCGSLHPCAVHRPPPASQCRRARGAIGRRNRTRAMAKHSRLFQPAPLHHATDFSAPLRARRASESRRRMGARWSQGCAGGGGRAGGIRRAFPQSCIHGKEQPLQAARNRKRSSRGLAASASERRAIGHGRCLRPPTNFRDQRQVLNTAGLRRERIRVHGRAGRDRTVPWRRLFPHGHC